MENLLTVKEVQGMLKIDRITVYRMLKDGRLTGIKIGQQWRFAQDEVESFITTPRKAEQSSPEISSGVLPAHCVQAIQDLFSTMAGVATIVLETGGAPLSEVSNPTLFTRLITATDAGRQARAGWLRATAQVGAGRLSMQRCTDGFRYLAAPIRIEDQTVAVVVAGPFADLDEPNHGKAIRSLAAICQVEEKALLAAAGSVPALDAAATEKLGAWLTGFAGTLEQIGRERAVLIERLRSIAAISSLAS